MLLTILQKFSCIPFMASAELIFENFLKIRLVLMTTNQIERF